MLSDKQKEVMRELVAAYRASGSIDFTFVFELGSMPRVTIAGAPGVGIETNSLDLEALEGRGLVALIRGSTGLEGGRVEPAGVEAVDAYFRES